MPPSVPSPSPSPSPLPAPSPSSPPVYAEPVPPPGAILPTSGAAHRLRVSLLMAGSCLPILGAVLIAPVLPKMQDHFATVPGAGALVPMALTVPALALGLLAPFAGVIVDRLGRKRLLIAATVLYAIFGTAPLWLESLGAIVASRALVGIAEAAIMTCCTTLIGDYYSGRVRDRYLALQTMCASASATAFFVIGGAAGSAGWRTPFWIYAVSLILAPLMAIGLPKPTAATDAVAEDGESTGTGVAPKRPFPFRQLAGICGLTVFGALVFYTVPVEMSYLLDDLDVTATSVIGLATAIASAATVAGAVTFAKLRGAPGPRLPLVLALCAAGFVVMWLADSAPLLIVGAVLNCLGTGLLLPSLLTIAMSKLDFADRGRGTGLWTASFFIGQFICPLVLIAAKSALGTLAAAVGLLGLAAAVVAAGLFLTARRRAAAVAPLPQ
ncbi:MFS transporter [Streptomyces stelliscabiei]|uniref:MFS transporter n=1 Tax=Streptomyces stelliscabiei TaxID=146820 RepID=UPI0029B2655C|nr:MFS transporter [Streptomyces stelliscabiei]MDX2556453.1 MFS transporter [Streptomyces stelliscabiei]MDX2615133.1 MFS transporter [Streptomyces stelliscabiei]MDX2640262.1 MFS transporter [Streptomyces stelliscabiei]MDX2665817.1 MFS transporter [Streptomyces stelliscabiei]MDX2716971.1 MFS transporter [Streptomyces stelliscabiei]